MKFRILASLVAVASAASVVSAVPSFGTVSPTKANGTFIPGNGVFANGFTIDTAATGESVALKARDRVNGQAISVSGNRYVVPQGLVGGNRAAWNFDFQFSPGTTGGAANSYTYELLADINPAFGAATFQTINIPSSNVGGPAGDSFFANPGAGAWSSDAVPFVIANSENYNFGFLAGSGFTNTGPAEYELVLTARDAATSAIVASTTIYAEVVPEPATLAALAGGAALLLGRRRRRQA